jgi:DNA repair protein RadD
MFKLRYYQQGAIDAIYTYFENGNGNPVIAQPTGTGKSVVIAGLLHRIYDDFPGQRIMMLTHVKELIEQNFEKLIGLWPTAPAGIYSAGLNRRDTSKPITFAGIQSVAKRSHEFGHIDLIVIDECHLVSQKDNTNYRKFIEELKLVNPYIKVIGLSATPYRLGVGLITDGGLFTDICYDNTTMDGFMRLVDEGYLMPLIPKKTDLEIDLSEVRTQGGEFVDSDLQRAVDQDSITRAALAECSVLGEERNHWLIFGTGIEHCNHIVDILEEYGIPAAVCHSGQSEELNATAIRNFKAGKITALVNNNKLTTGFDFPGIDMIVALRPTKSPGLWVQMLGRGTRPVYTDGYDLQDIEQRLASIAAGPKQNCLVLDFAGNTRRLGPINDPLIPKKKGEKGNGIAPVRLCVNKMPGDKVCNTICHASIRICPVCGFEFPKTVRIGETAASEALMASSMPQMEIFKVSRVTYSRHTKMDRPDSIKVTIFAGLRKFTTYVCLEHGGGAGRMARAWWAERCEWEAPETVQEALDYASNLKVPTHIGVWINKKYPEVKGYDFTGTAFGTIGSDGAAEGLRRENP